jgi:hypothetical protein
VYWSEDIVENDGERGFMVGRVRKAILELGEMMIVIDKMDFLGILICV